MTALILFWCSIILLMHSYAFYPLILHFLAKGKELNSQTFKETDKLPFVEVILPVFNEEKVIEEKIMTLIDQKYPGKINILIGSDGSSDNTDNICRELESKYDRISFIRFDKRRGKIAVLNDLTEKSRAEILILTDANVLLNPAAIYHLVKHFKNPEIGVTGANVVTRNPDPGSIALQESVYIYSENKIKYLEGKVWGAMAGAFGACYAIRRDLFQPVPRHYLVDDFYLTMNVLKQGKKAIQVPEAICMEDVSVRSGEEFRRKARISAGNFQNLFRFAGLLWPPVTGIAFSFFSHKILRWFGPFFLITLYLSNALLAGRNIFYYDLFIIQNVLLFIVILDAVLSKFGMSVKGFRYIAHFYMMNLALLSGFFRFLFGIKSSIWQPTERN